MIEKQNDPQMIEKKVITKPIDYAVTTIVEVPKELPKVSMVNSCLKKLKFHLASFDMELFTSFDQCLIDEVTEVQNIFKQMELAVEQHYAEKTKFQTKMKNVLQENDRLLTQALSVKIVNTVLHDNVKFDCLNVDACTHCVTTESELKPDFIKKECYETLLQQYHILETHCISLEVNNQLNTKIFQRDTESSPVSAPIFAELFEINDLKAQVQEKDTVILKLKEKINSFSGDVKERKVKDEEKEGSMHQLALHLKQLPGVQADLPQGADDQPIVQTSQHPEWFSQPRRPPSSDRDWNKTLPAAQGDAQSWISELARQTDARSSFNKLLDTPIDFSNFIMNRLGIATLTPC
nr:hypothetical protein [Tanacetum cinerariifolium]